MILGVLLLLNPFICFVGCQCQVKVLGKAIAPLTTQQASENGDFYLQNYHNYKISNSWFFPPCGPTTSPIVQKRSKLLPFGMSQPFVSITVSSVNHRLSFGPTVHIIFPQNLKWLYKFTVFFTLVLCLEFGSRTYKLSKLHLRSTRNVHKWCMYVNDASLGVSPCQWDLVCEFW